MSDEDDDLLLDPLPIQRAPSDASKSGGGGKRVALFDTFVTSNPNDSATYVTGTNNSGQAGGAASTSLSSTSSSEVNKRGANVDDPGDLTTQEDAVSPGGGGGGENDATTKGGKKKKVKREVDMPEQPYEIPLNLDNPDSLVWAKPSSVWRPGRLLSRTEIQTITEDEDDLKEGEVLVEIIPERDNGKAYSMKVKKATQVREYNYQEQDGGPRWSSALIAENAKPKKKGKGLLTKAEWQFVMKHAEEALRKVLAAKKESDARLAEVPEPEDVVASDDEQEEEKATAETGEEEIMDSKRGRGTVTLKPGDIIEYRLANQSASAPAHRTFIIATDPNNEEYPVDVHISFKPSREVRIIKVGKFQKNKVVPVPVEQQKDMKLGEHLILKVAKLSEEQIAQRGGTLATQIKEMMAKNTEALNAALKKHDEQEEKKAKRGGKRRRQEEEEEEEEAEEEEEEEEEDGTGMEE